MSEELRNMRRLEAIKDRLLTENARLSAENERLRAALKDALHEVATGYYGNAKSIITRALGSADDGSDVIATKLDTIMNADADSSAVSRE